MAGLKCEPEIYQKKTIKIHSPARMID